MSLSEDAKSEATIKIPFKTSHDAEIAYRVLNVDKEPRLSFVEKQLRLEGNQLEVHFKADQVKNLRTAITGFFEAVLLCIDTIKEFSITPEVEKENNSAELIDNAGAHTGTHTA